MHERDDHAFARGVASLAALIGILGGVPALLAATVGWPFPHHLPSPHGVAHALGSPLDDATLAKLLGGAAWLAWAWFAIAFLIEITSRTPRGRRQKARRNKTGRAGLGRTAAAALITNAAVLFAILPGLSGAPAQAAPIAAVSTVTTLTSSPPTAAPAQAQPLYTVVRYDTLWGIAKAELSDPLRWTEIYAINEGRVQPGGGVLDDPALILPGWQLVLPAGAAGPAVAAPAPSAPPAAPSSRSPFPATAPAPQPRPAEPEPVVLPAPSQSHESMPAAPDQRGTESAKPRESRPHAVGVSTESHAPLSVGAALIAGVLIAALAKLRRVQMRRRRPGRRIPLPLGRAAATEAKLMAAAKRSRTDATDAALRAYAACGAPPGALVGLVVAEDGVDLVLDRAIPAPEPFASWPESRTWHLDPEAVSNEALDCLPSTPAVATLGTSAGNPVLANLAALGTIGIAGDEERAQAMLHKLALELATAPWAEQSEVVLFGWGEDLAGSFSRIERESTTARLRARLSRIHGEPAEPEAEDDARVFSANGNGNRCPFWPTTVFLLAEAPDAELAELLRSATVIARVAVLVAGQWDEAAVTIDGLASELDLPGLDLTITPEVPAPSELADIDELFAVAASNADVAPTDPPYAAITEAPAACEVQLNLLGPVEFIGVKAPEVNKSLELLVYLSLHPGPVSNDVWATALWPEPLPKSKTRWNVTSLARACFDPANSGAALRAEGRTSELVGVGTDWAMFCELSRSDQPNDWDDAMALVRGRVCETLAAPTWLVTEGLLATIEAEISDVGVRLSEHHLEAGAAVRARNVARIALKAVPYDERVWRALLKASHAVGGVSMVRQVWREMCTVLEVEVDTADEIEPETHELRARLIAETREGSGQAEELNALRSYVALS